MFASPKGKLFTAILGFLIVAVSANAQFTSLIGEKAFSKWSEISTNEFKVIYPSGMDSLGYKYLKNLEAYRKKVGNTVGFMPNQRFDMLLPVVLHPYMATTNGLTTLAPSRLELFTFPDAYSLLPPVPLDKLLSIHEIRHSAQTQFASYGFWRAFPSVFGEAAPLVVEGLYLNVALAEGDAVVAETAFTNSGRGRTAGFLSYYRMAFDNGDKRNWFRWRYGSQRYYTPDYYTIGYMTVAGARYLYDDPMFMNEYLYRSLNPFHFNSMGWLLRSYSEKGINRTWYDIADQFAAIWADDDKARGPFQEIEPMLTDKKRYFQVYSGSVETSDGRLLTVRSGLDRATELAQVMPNGTVRSLRPFNADSKIVYSAYTDCIYWTEAISDVRWELYQQSRIRSMKVGETSIRDFTDQGMYANPSISDDGKKMAVVSYTPEGDSRIVLFSLEDGSVIKSVNSLGGVTLQEVAFCGDKVVMTGLSDPGVGLYITDFESVKVLENPVPFKVFDLISKDGTIYFTSDKNGTNEIYSYTVNASGVAGILRQITNTKYGVSDPFFHDGKLCFSALQPEGKVLAGADNLLDREVKYSERAEYPIADKLSKQEQKIYTEESKFITYNPTAHRKGLLGLRVHSWVPMYINQSGNTASASEYPYERASLGFTLYFQDFPTTLQGSVGFSFHERNYAELEDASITGGFHTRLVYTGLFPQFSLALDIGDRKPSNSVKGESYDSTIGNFEAVSSELDDSRHKTFMGGSLVTSIPLNFSSGGWYRSLNPFVGVMGSTDRWSDTYCDLGYSDDNGRYSINGPQVELQYYPVFSLVVGLTGGIETGTAVSGIYPRLGFGGGIKYSRNTFSNTLYSTAYGYLPGLTSVQGLKLSASMQLVESASGSIQADIWGIDAQSMAPRGYDETSADFFLISRFYDSYKVSVDYAMPILPVDLALGQFVYLRNLELLPFFDYTWAMGDGRNDEMFSAGADLMFRFEKFLINSNTQKVGFRFSYNRSTLDNILGVNDPFFVGAVAGISF